MFDRTIRLDLHIYRQIATSLNSTKIAFVMEISTDLDRNNIASFEVRIRPGGYNKDVFPVREM